MIKTREFSQVVGEGYSVIRNVYKDPEKAPKAPGNIPADFLGRSHRRYVATDAIAFRFTRELSDMGMLWADAATAVRNSQFWYGDRWHAYLVDPSAMFFVWSFNDAPDLCTWLGDLTDAASLMAGDGKDGKTGGLKRVYAFNISRAFKTACEIAAENGFELDLQSGEIIDHGDAS